MGYYKQCKSKVQFKKRDKLCFLKKEGKGWQALKQEVKKIVHMQQLLKFIFKQILKQPII